MSDRVPQIHHNSVLATLPTAITSAAHNASRRFLEFFAATIHNPNARRAYIRALLWLDDVAGILSLA